MRTLGTPSPCFSGERRFLLAVLLFVSCTRERATAEQCRVIFDRMVELELRELGFKDAALAKLRQDELAARYRDELSGCTGRPLPEGAMACVATATSAEDISHRCLR